MNADELIKKYGSPDIQVSMLRFWIHGREFPDSIDFWDGNWVNITVHCSTQGAEVWGNGPILHLSELQKWMEDCERIQTTLSGSAELKCMEPHLHIQMKINKTGHIDTIVSLTPDHLHQTHKFEFLIDQSYLPDIIRDCREVLIRLPLREAPVA